MRCSDKLWLHSGQEGRGKDTDWVEELGRGQEHRGPSAVVVFSVIAKYFFFFFFIGRVARFKTKMWDAHLNVNVRKTMNNF